MVSRLELQPSAHAECTKAAECGLWLLPQCVRARTKGFYPMSRVCRHVNGVHTDTTFRTMLGIRGPSEIRSPIRWPFCFFFASRGRFSFPFRLGRNVLARRLSGYVRRKICKTAFKAYKWPIRARLGYFVRCIRRFYASRFAINVPFRSRLFQRTNRQFPVQLSVMFHMNLLRCVMKESGKKRWLEWRNRNLKYTYRFSIVKVDILYSPWFSVCA